MGYFLGNLEVASIYGYVNSIPNDQMSRTELIPTAKGSKKVCKLNSQAGKVIWYLQRAPAAQAGLNLYIGEIFDIFCWLHLMEWSFSDQSHRLDYETRCIKPVYLNAFSS